MGDAPGLSDEQRRALDRLSKLPVLGSFCLADGTGLAIWLAHRRSEDLDFFSGTPSVDLDAVNRAVAGLRDLAVMKLVAIARRGLRRDFWDLYEALQHTGLPLRACGEA